MPVRLLLSLGAVLVLTAGCASGSANRTAETAITRSADTELPAGQEVAILQQKFVAYSGQKEGFRVVRSEEITEFARQLDEPVEPSREQLLVAAMGPQKTGGYYIQFSQVVETEEKLWVEVTRVGPDSECHVTMAETSPMQLAVIARSEKPVEFVVRPLERRPCN
jgi:hypothetical protein